MRVNVIIPMAGAGSRFEKMGYTFPKPLIEVYDGKPMIQCVVENLIENTEESAEYLDFYFLAQQEHIEKYHLKKIFYLLFSTLNDYYGRKDRFWIVPVEGLTEGAACTTLLAKDWIKNQDLSLIIANSDQLFDGELSLNLNFDGTILGFNSIHPKWSFAEVDKHNFVTKVAEKDPISNLATVGVYWWKKTSDYFKFAEQMIEKDIRTNGEFYVCPVFNQAIEAKQKINFQFVDRMYGLGTPEDLNLYVHRQMLREEL